MSNTVDASRVAEFEDCDDELQRKAKELAALVRQSRYTVFFTGAGVSTAAGIADYRGPSGCWTMRRIKELETMIGAKSAAELEELEKLQAELEREVTKSAAKVSKEFASPTFAHMAIATMVHQDLVQYVVTTNLDGLHRKSGLLGHRELCCLHGDAFVERCTKCGMDFERNFRVRRANSHVHDHRASTGGSCTRCGSSTPQEWTGQPKGGRLETKTVRMQSRPKSDAITLQKINESVQRLWPNLPPKTIPVLLSINDTSVEGQTENILQKVVAEASLPLLFRFRVGSSGGAPTGGITSFQQNGLVGVCDRNVGTKDTHINFGESLDDIDWDEADEHCRKADLCIVLGTSMSLPHCTHFPFLAKRTVIVNLQATPHDHRCHKGLRIWGKCDDVLELLMENLGLQVEEVPAWRPKDPLSLAQMTEQGLSSRCLALAQHIESEAQRREQSAQTSTEDATGGSN